MTIKSKVDRSDLALNAFDELLKSGVPLEGAFAETALQFPDHVSLLADAAMFRAAEPPLDSAREFDQAFERAVSARSVEPVSDLLALITSRGLTPKSAGETLGVGSLILRKLSQRLIVMETIPAQLITALADLIYEPVDRISTYLSLPPALDGSLQTHRTASKSATVESFQAAVAAAPPSEKIDPRWIGENKTRE